MMDSTHPAGANDSEVVTTATGPTMRDRFRGFLPVVVDIETGGFNCQTDAILEIAMTLLKMSEDGQLEIAETHSRNVEPFEGANLDPSALEFTGIDPESPLRGAVPGRRGGGGGRRRGGGGGRDRVTLFQTCVYIITKKSQLTRPSASRNTNSQQ